CDNNLNGTFEATGSGDTSESGAVVTLKLGNTVIGTKTTDGSGSFSFTGLDAGTYTVTLTTPSAGHQAEQSHGAVTIPVSYTVTVGGNSTGIKFAEIDLGSVSGTVFLDVNDSGIQGDNAGDVG